MWRRQQEKQYIFSEDRPGGPFWRVNRLQKLDAYQEELQADPDIAQAYSEFCKPPERKQSLLEVLRNKAARRVGAAAMILATLGATGSCLAAINTPAPSSSTDLPAAYLHPNSFLLRGALQDEGMLRALGLCSSELVAQAHLEHAYLQQAPADSVQGINRDRATWFYTAAQVAAQEQVACVPAGQPTYIFEGQTMVHDDVVRFDASSYAPWCSERQRASIEASQLPAGDPTRIYNLIEIEVGDAWAAQQSIVCK